MQTAEGLPWVGWRFPPRHLELWSPHLEQLVCVDVWLSPSHIVHIFLSSDLCDPTDSSPPGFSAYGISQARTQEEVAISSSRRSSRPRDLTHISWVFCLGRRILCHWATGNILLIPNCLKTSFFVDLFKLEPDKEKVAYLVVMIKSGYLCYWNNVLFCFTKRL